MNTLTILIGLPACGKSTWRNKEPGRVCSTDDIIELIADRIGTTYNEVFRDVIDEATGLFKRDLADAIATGGDIIIDRTNLTPKSRQQFIRQANNKGYTSHAVVFDRPTTRDQHDEWNRRLASRPGKTIPDSVLANMYESFTEPTLDEGFTTITFLNTFENDTIV